jgi:release factor glutamine methyltransferase
VQNTEHTVKSLLDFVKNSLAPCYPSQEARALAHLLLESLLNMRPATLYVSLEQPVDAERAAQVEDAVAQLLAMRPVQYVLGRAEFCGLPMLVNEHTLIPRPETEELVDWAVKRCAALPAGAALRALDVGTGTGCIAVALAKQLPQAEVHAWDVSAAALAVARRNAELNGVQVHFAQVDMLAAGDVAPVGGVRLIVSNPPYVCESEKRQLRDNVLRYEPPVALFVPDSDPLLFYRALAGLAQRALTGDGELFVEVNERFGAATAALLAQRGFATVELRSDINGKPRMVRAAR